MMKNMYEEGDENMKKVIGEAMLKSRNGERPDPKSYDDMPKFPGEEDDQRCQLAEICNKTVVIDLNRTFTLRSRRFAALKACLITKKSHAVQTVTQS